MRAVLLLIAAGGLVFAASSCRTANRVTVMLPNVPGAKYIGSKECEQCHEEILPILPTADHAVLTMADQHLERRVRVLSRSRQPPLSSGGETKPPYSFTAGRPAANSFGANPTTPNARAIETACFTCHAEVRGQFTLPSHHPVPEGK